MAEDITRQGASFGGFAGSLSVMTPSRVLPGADWVQCAACAQVYAARKTCPRCGETRSFQAELSKRGISAQTSAKPTSAL